MVEILFSWLLLALQVKVVKVASFVGKIGREPILVSVLVFF